jgi:hypothetical protein
MLSINGYIGAIALFKIIISLFFWVLFEGGYANFSWKDDIEVDFNQMKLFASYALIIVVLFQAR